jgi:hypothetical protein
MEFYSPEESLILRTQIEAVPSLTFGTPKYFYRLLRASQPKPFIQNSIKADTETLDYLNENNTISING